MCVYGSTAALGCKGGDSPGGGAGGAPPPAVGLSSCHIGPPDPGRWDPRRHALVGGLALEVAEGGAYARLRGTDIRYPGDLLRRSCRRGYPRGKVRGFSRRSGSRLRQRVAQIDRRAGVPLFVTLTYGRSWPEDWQSWKSHLKAFWKRVVRVFPRASVIWRLEFQSRGAPHFHLLVWGIPYLPHEWVARAWYEVVGSGDLDHLRAGTEVRRVRSWRGVSHYVSKYLAKPSDSADLSDAGVGRWWGILGRRHLPVRLLVRSLSRSEFVALRRLLWRILESRRVPVRRGRAGPYTGVWVALDWGVACRLCG